MVEKLSENQLTNMSDDTVSNSIIICGGGGQNTDPQSMDYPNGPPKWTTLKWTTPKNTVSDEYYIKKLRFYTYTTRTCIFLFRMAFSRHVE